LGEGLLLLLFLLLFHPTKKKKTLPNPSREGGRG
jgi:hypothetical protein